MRILSIETSCDETSIAIVEFKNSIKPKILSEIVSSQIKIHQQYGGVVPNLANREHQKNLVSALKFVLKKADLLNLSKKSNLSTSHVNRLKKIFEREQDLLKNFLKEIFKISPPDIDLIAVSKGPGLAPALWTGVNFSQALSYLWKKPLIGINHLEGHIYSNFIKEPINLSKSGSNRLKIKFPALVLLVSGGHTMIILTENHLKYKILGETLDDAAGEAFDKAAKILGLGYPGGPIISKKAKIGNPKIFNLPRPMFNSKNYNFSFSGLKTAFLYLLRKIQDSRFKIQDSIINDLCASFEQAVIDVLNFKFLKAAKEYKIKSVMLCGGVSANEKLRKTIAKSIKKELPQVKFFTPDIKYSTDNAVMIATAAYYRNKLKKINRQKFSADPNLKLK